VLAVGGLNSHGPDERYDRLIALDSIKTIDGVPVLGNAFDARRWRRR
jgi:hypothetical protein